VSDEPRAVPMRMTHDYMSRRRLLAGLLLSFAAPIAAEAKQGAQAPRIGYLATDLAAGAHNHEAFQRPDLRRRQGVRPRRPSAAKT
jgi:hypothetical protein